MKHLFVLGRTGVYVLDAKQDRWALPRLGGTTLDSRTIGQNLSEGRRLYRVPLRILHVAARGGAAGL